MNKHVDQPETMGRESVPLRAESGRFGRAGESRPTLQCSSAWHAQLEQLVTRIYLLPNSPVPQILAFLEPGPGEYGSKVCGRSSDLLASRTRASVCLVEANQNAISAQERRALKHQKGLADLLANPELTVKSVAARAFGRDLWLLAGGFPLSAGSLQDGYEQLSDRMRELRACFDYILIDAPPLGTSRAPIVLAQLADAAVLVLPASGAHRKSICRLKQELEAAGITLLGAALVDKPA